MALAEMDVSFKNRASLAIIFMWYQCLSENGWLTAEVGTDNDSTIVCSLAAVQLRFWLVFA